VAVTSAQLESAARLRHEVLVEDEGRSFAHDDGSARMLLEAIDQRSLVLIARDEREPEDLDNCLASVRMTWANDAMTDGEIARDLMVADLPPADHGRTMVLSRIVVRQGTGGRLQLPKLLALAYRLAVNNGATRAVVAIPPTQAAFFEGLGFVSTMKRVNGEGGTREVLVLDLLDRRQMAAVRSVFLGALDDFNDNRASSNPMHVAA
jgi:hypothetical protein